MHLIQIESKCFIACHDATPANVCECYFCCMSASAACHVEETAGFEGHSDEFAAASKAVAGMCRVPGLPFPGWRHRLWHGHPPDFQDQGGIPRPYDDDILGCPIPQGKHIFHVLKAWLFRQQSSSRPSATACITMHPLFLQSQIMGPTKTISPLWKGSSRLTACIPF